MEVFLPTLIMKENMPRLEKEEMVVQQDGASLHMGRGTPRKLSLAGREDRWSIKLVTRVGAVSLSQHQQFGGFRISEM